MPPNGTSAGELTHTESDAPPPVPLELDDVVAVPVEVVVMEEEVVLGSEHAADQAVIAMAPIDASAMHERSDRVKRRHIR